MFDQLGRFMAAVVVTILCLIIIVLALKALLWVVSL